MPMRNAKHLAALGVVLANLSMPVGLAASSLLATGCLIGSPGPSDVSQGRQYTSGDQAFDAFFNELYQTQVALAQAPDRVRLPRERVAEALALGAQSTADQIGDALDKRADQMAKGGSALRLSIAGVDDPTGIPAATVSTSTQPADPNDRNLVNVIAETASGTAAALADVRRARPVIERLRQQADILEPNVSSTFRKEGRRKRAEVEKNLADAKRMIPLMSLRVDAVEKDAVALLHFMEKAAHHEPAAPPPPPPPPEEGGKKKKKKPTAGATAPAAAGASKKPAAPPPPSGGASKKPAAPPPSPDYEP